jgi:hypothetical protein
MEVIMISGFSLKSGTSVKIENNRVHILKDDGKSASNGMFAGRAAVQIVIKLSAITAMIQNVNYLLICASGLPKPTDFKITNLADIKQFPNCIVGEEAELKEVYDAINSLF